MNHNVSSTMMDSPLARRCRSEQICTRFEEAFKAGLRPGLREFLGETPDVEQAELFKELLPLEVFYRRKAGEAPNPADYTFENSELAEVVNAFFSVLNEPADRQRTSEFPSVPGYTVECQLGRGGMGVVYLARQHQPRRLVALKMIRDGTLTRKEASRRFQTEADAVARMQHPNIVPVYAVGEVDGRAFMVLEYVPGGSLDEHLKGQPIPPRDAARLVETLVRAVAHAHSLGVIHRDLKPANVLMPDILQPANLKVTDFGLAKLLEDSTGPTLTGETLGTPSYMAPEQARGDGSLIGRGTDIYSLGTILYELVTGRPPFTGPSAISTLQQVINFEPVSPRQLQPSLPRDLETICLKCLEKLPQRRYATALDLADDLSRFYNGEPITARPLGQVERACRWSKRHPTIVAIVICMAIGFVAQTVAVFRLRLAQQAEHEARQRRSQSDAGSRSFAHYFGIDLRRFRND